MLGVNATLDLAYGYPPAAATVIDPSVATVNVSQTGAYWSLAGSVAQGSYSPGKVRALLKPISFGGQTCGTGITSEYIKDQSPISD
jgi:hypothetical protein